MKGRMKISLNGWNINMKKLFDKSNFVLQEFDKKQKHQSLVVSILLILFFIIASFSFFNALYSFADAVGSIVSGSPDIALRDLVRNLPLFLTLFMSIWGLLLLQASFRKVNDKKWHRSLMKDAICLIAFAGVNILYVIVGLIDGTYSSIVEGSPSAIFPLDSVIFSIAFVLIGMFVILYLKKYQESHPYLVPTRGQIVTKARGLYCTFVTFWLLVALFGFAGGLYTIFIYDFVHGYAFYGIATIFAYLLPAILLGFWEFNYNELKEDKKKEILLPLSIISLCASVIVTVLYFVSLGTNLDAPSNAGFGMFPVTFAANVNIATMIVVITPLVVSVTALIKGILLRRK